MYNGKIYTVCTLKSLLFLDAKGIKIGGFKAPKPRISVPKPSISRPSIPLIVPVPIILPVGGFGRNYYVNKNSSKFENCVKAHILVNLKIILLSS